MTALPAKGDFDGSTPGHTTGIFQAAQGALRDFLNELLGGGSSNVMAAKAQAQAALGISGMRNKIINGNFAINQRAVAGTVTLPGGAYGHDMWRAGGAGCQYSFAASGIDTILTINSGSLGQVIESGLVDGGIYVISWEGTSQLQLGGSASASSPFITAAVPVGSTGFGVGFGPGTLTRVQIESAIVPTPYERRPLPVELALCQRYYCQAPSGNSAFTLIGQANSTSSAYGHIAFPVPMRVAPTWQNSGTAARLGGELISAMTPVAVTPYGVLVTFGPTSTFQNNSAVVITGATAAPVWNAFAGL